MEQPFPHPGGTGEATGAASDLLAFGPDDGVPAEGTPVGHLPLPLLAGAGRHHRPHHLGDHVPCPSDHHQVADAQVLAADLVFVVQGGVGDDRATHLHRLQHRVRSGGPGPPDVDLDVQETGGAFLGGELVGDRPAGSPGGESELLLVSERIDLHHHPVGLVVELVAALLGVDHVPFHLFQVLHRPGFRVDPQSERLQVLQGLGVGLEGRSVLDVTELVHPDRQGTRRGDLGVLLPDRPGCRVTGIGEDPLPRFHLPAV